MQKSIAYALKSAVLSGVSTPLAKALVGAVSPLVRNCCAALVFQHDAVTWELVAAAGLMAVGVWLHLSERHVHEHTHEIQSHVHEHVHDEHHQHSHAPGDGKEPHTHEHVHVPLSHAHVHYPDIHHRHKH